MSETQYAAVFAQRLDALEIEYDPRAPERLAAYHEMLGDWNTRMNLTGDASFEAMLDRHYVDSLAPLQLDGVFAQGASVIDVGSGAGLPGVPLAIARPDLKVVLLDSLGKRVTFLNAVIEALGLTNARAVHARAEDAARDPALRERFDRAVARAVAPLSVLMELLLPFARVGGAAVCYKGPAAEDEREAGRRAAALLGGGALSVRPVAIPAQPDWRHCIVVSEKKQKTVRQYPRKAGTPAKEPLG